MLKAKGVTKSYRDLKILKGVDFDVNEGEIVSIVGASGAGKSTFLHILGTLDQADKGEITFHGTNIGNLSGKSLSSFRNKNIGFVFQFHHLLPEFTALENICIPGYIAGDNKKQVEKRAQDWLNFFDLSDRSAHKPAALSGGEQQRVAIARALINKAKIIFADEPSGNLDSANASALHDLFVKLKKDFKQTFVLVTHNTNLAEISDRVVTMKDGIIA